MFDFISVLIILFAYFIGNISPATLISKKAGIDIRKEGSKNPGTTNMLRVVGKKGAALTLLLDIIKGFLAVYFAKRAGSDALAVLACLAVFLGHVWPIVYKFKGGKGIATGFGALLAINLNLAFGCMIIAILGIVSTRMVSVGSLLAAIALPFLSYYFVKDYYFIFLIITIIIIVKHRENIRRLLRKEESKISFKK